MDEMDLEEQFGSLENAFASYGGRALLMSFDTDWLFPTREVARVHEAMARAGVDATHIESRRRTATTRSSSTIT